MSGHNDAPFCSRPVLLCGQYAWRFVCSLALACAVLQLARPEPVRAAPPRLVDDLIKRQVLESLSQAVRAPVISQSQRSTPSQWSRRAIIESLDQHSRGQVGQVSPPLAVEPAAIELATTTPPLLKRTPGPRTTVRGAAIRLAPPAHPLRGVSADHAVPVSYDAPLTTQPNAPAVISATPIAAPNLLPLATPVAVAIPATLAGPPSQALPPVQGATVFIDDEPAVPLSPAINPLRPAVGRVPRSAYPAANGNPLR